MRWPSAPKVPGSGPGIGIGTPLIYSAHLYVQVALKGYCPVMVGGNEQCIGSTVSDAIICSWLWSTVTGSCPFGLLQ